ncbi:MAG: hypothetical protein IAE99_03590 [Rhodothermales bacterium]|nr:hypothetical protein [Rhodothermales bacterium]
MRQTFKLGSWLAAVGLAFTGLAAPSATAQDCDNGHAYALFDINNVSAPIYTTGSLFYPDYNGVHYEVPKGSGLSPNYASNVWIGGYADNELRLVANTYGQNGGYDYYPGPLPANGTPLTASQCAQWDRIWKINKTDITALNNGAAPTTDILEWPWQIGAPVVDGDGVPGNYNLAGGDRPEVLGDQMMWWVLNDASGPHVQSLAPAIGLEIQVSAFAFRKAGPLNSMTFYRYRLLYKPKDGKTLKDTYFGVWADPDLGVASDDYVGVDTNLSLAYIYNADNADVGAGGYGSTSLPAFGIDFFQGPLVPAPGETWTDPSGVTHMDKTRLGASSFAYFTNGAPVEMRDPATSLGYYYYLTSRWADGAPFTEGGNGRGGTVPVKFTFPAMPPAYWSEDQPTVGGSPNAAGDRRFVISTGPFTLQPGDVQDIVFGMVFSRGSDRFKALQQLKTDDDLAQKVFDYNFLPTVAPDPVDSLIVSEQNQKLVLTWNNLPTNNNFQEQYEATIKLERQPGAADTTYNFQGYKLYQYRNRQDDAGVVIKTFDIADGVTTVVDPTTDPNTGAVISYVSANGTDSGVEKFFTVTTDAFTGDPLRNYTEYCFGVVAYGYSDGASPQIIESAPTVQCATPQRITRLAGGSELNSTAGDTLAITHTGPNSEGKVVARVANPTALTGDTYRVKFDTVHVNGEVLTVYSLVNSTTNTTLFDGKAYTRRTGTPPAYGENVFTYDGVTYSITNPEAGIKAFLTTHNASAALTDIGGALPCDFNSLCYPSPTRPSPDLTGMAGYWAINLYPIFSSGYSDFATFVDFGIGYGNQSSENLLGAHDFEMRFTATGSVAATRQGAYPYSGTAMTAAGTTPFELWDIGIGTPNDPSDDVRLVPYFLDFAPLGVWNLRTRDHEASGGTNDPLTEALFWGYPDNRTPGQAGYLAEAAAIASGTYTFKDNVFSFQTLVSVNGGDVTAVPFAPAQAAPPTGAVFRIVTNKPFQPGEALSINTSTYSPTRNNADLAKAALDDIGIVPNPYRGRSDYDVSAFQSEVRFVNIPAGSLVRVYTLSGHLIKTLNVGAQDFIPWDLRTDSGLPVASGLYLVHVDVPGVGEKVIKFGVVQHRIQLNTF